MRADPTVDGNQEMDSFGSKLLDCIEVETVTFVKTVGDVHPGSVTELIEKFEKQGA